jgi:hypothetical protein
MRLMAEEKTDNSVAPAGGGATSTESGPARHADPTSSAQRDEFDPLGWIVPVVCKDCGKDFELPYRHFQAGVVFHCPHCHGSFVPNLPMYRAVHDAFESFYAKRKRDREAAISRGDEEAAWRQRQALELAAFRKSLEELARAMRPAGKMVKRKGLAAMFT